MRRGQCSGTDGSWVPNFFSTGNQFKAWWERLPSLPDFFTGIYRHNIQTRLGCVKSRLLLKASSWVLRSRLWLSRNLKNKIIFLQYQILNLKSVCVKLIISKWIIIELPSNTLLLYKQNLGSNGLLTWRKLREGISLGKGGRNWKAVFHTGHTYLSPGYIKNL